MSRQLPVRCDDTVRRVETGGDAFFATFRGVFTSRKKAHFAFQRPAMDARYVVRYGATRQIGEFGTKGRDDYARGAAVIVRSDRGVECGEVLSRATDRTRELLGVTEAKGSILREVTEQDRRKLDDISKQERDAFRGGLEVLAERKLAMQLIDIEHLFGGERLIFYYIAETRIDFRELVKSLAARFRMRIEMRQIGVRDEAKLLADYGDCGKPVCCNTHLREMPPVSMKMAKLQKATLDPNKISGRCGRLKCCLRYEYDTYEEYRRELPGLGALVVTKQGQGRVIGQEILARKVLVQYPDNRHLLADLSDVLTVVSKGKKPSDTEFGE
jgi:cell fate regulator YaaT (PSP1 superfamily)